MKRSVIGLALALGLAGMAQAAEPWRISPEGVGPVRVGMSTKQAMAVLRPAPDATGIGDPKTCEEYATGGAHHINFMIQENRVTRVSAGDGVATPEGVKVGDPVAAVHKAYPTLEKDDAPYGEPPAHDLYWWQTPTNGLRFEIDERGRVAAIHGGDESIRYMEGCL